MLSNLAKKLLRKHFNSRRACFIETSSFQVIHDLIGERCVDAGDEPWKADENMELVEKRYGSDGGARKISNELKSSVGFIFNVFTE